MKYHLTQEMIDLKKLEILERMTTKKEERKDDKNKNWWTVNPIKLWIVLVLLYPFVGVAYSKLFFMLWK